MVGRLLESISALETGGQVPIPFLLHGVTGSGKTEVYLRSLERAWSSGKAPWCSFRIALTPQTVERFRSRFDHAGGGDGAQVAVLHSHLSDAERREEWMRLQSGEASDRHRCGGARSWLPSRNLGIIIVDEEHENTYKQEETPRYHARDVAVMRARL